MEHQGEIALVLEYNSIDKSVTIISATELGENFSKEDKEMQNWKLAFQYSAPEKKKYLHFGCRNGWGFKKFNSEMFPATSWLIT